MFGLLPVWALEERFHSVDEIVKAFKDADVTVAIQHLSLLNKKLSAMDRGVTASTFSPSHEDTVRAKIKDLMDQMDSNDNLKRQTFYYQNQWLDRLRRSAFVKFNPMTSEHIKTFGLLYELYRKGKSTSTSTSTGADAENLWKNTLLWHDSNELSLRLLQYFAQKHSDHFADMVTRNCALDLTKDISVPLAAAAVSQMLLELFPVMTIYGQKELSGIKLYKVLFEETKALEEVFCVAFMLFDRAWTTMSHTALPFKLADCVKNVKERISQELQKDPPKKKKSSTLVSSGSGKDLSSSSSSKKRRGSDSSSDSHSSSQQSIPVQTASAAAAAGSPYLDTLRALAAKAMPVPHPPADGSEDDKFISTWSKERILAKIATWSLESSRSPAESGDRMQALKRLQRLLDREEREALANLGNNAATNTAAATAEEAEKNVDADADGGDSSKKKDKKDKKKTKKSSSASSTVGWNSLTSNNVQNLVCLMLNSSKYEDRSLLMPHLLGHNRLLFKASLGFLSQLMRKCPKRAVDITIAARKFNQEQGNNSAFENFIECARLNNNIVIEQTLDVVLEMMECDPDVGAELMAANFMEPLSAFAAHCLEPPMSLLRLQSVLLNRFAVLAARPLDPAKNKADVDLLLDFWKQSFPDQQFKAESAGYKSKQWMFLGFESDDPLEEFKTALTPVLCAAFGKLHREEYQEIVQNRIYQRTFDYNFIRGAETVATVFSEQIIDELLKIDELIAPLFAMAQMLEELFALVWMGFDAHWNTLNKEDDPKLRLQVATTAARVVRILFFTEKDLASMKKKTLEEMAKPNPGETLSDVAWQSASVRSVSLSAAMHATANASNAPAAPRAGLESRTGLSAVPVAAASPITIRLKRILAQMAAKQAGEQAAAAEQTTGSGSDRHKSTKLMAVVTGSSKRGSSLSSSPSSGELGPGSSAGSRGSDKSSSRAYRKGDGSGGSSSKSGSSKTATVKITRSQTESPRTASATAALGGGGAESESDSVAM